MKQERPSRHIIQIPPTQSACTGCASCEMVCSLVHDGIVGPMFARLTCTPGPTRKMLHTIVTCQQCSDPPCYEACPKKDRAFCLDRDGISYINESECIGCGLCEKACIMEPSRIKIPDVGHRTDRKAKKCDLCRTRPEGPACVQWCPARCLAVSDGAVTLGKETSVDE